MKTIEQTLTTVPDSPRAGGPHGGPPRPVMVLIYGPDPRRIGDRLVLSAGTNIVGRASPALLTGAGAVPLMDARISSSHAEMTPLGDGRLRVRDLGSTNGVITRRGRADDTVLEPGEVIQLGRTFLMYRVEPPFPWAPPDTRILGISYAAHRMRDAVARAARHGAPVLVSGPPGSGKELVAHEIHRLSDRAQGPFVPVNCASLEKGIADSELFGHERGAFTGADRAKTGFVARADNGMLFLDEVFDLDERVQPKLLRALQEKAIQPVGGSRGEIAVDFRLVTASHRDPDTLIRGGRFRLDLYRRICAGGAIHTPPLRERLEDVPALAQDWLTRRGHLGHTLAPALVWALTGCPWPNNVGALYGLIEAAVVDADNGVIPLTVALEDRLADEARLFETLNRMDATLEDADAGEAAPGANAPAAVAPKRKRRRRPPCQDLADALAAQGGEVTRVAEQFGVSRKTIYEWIAKCELDLDRFRA